MEIIWIFVWINLYNKKNYNRFELMKNNFCNKWEEKISAKNESKLITYLYNLVSILNEFFLSKYVWDNVYILKIQLNFGILQKNMIGIVYSRKKKMYPMDILLKFK